MWQSKFPLTPNLVGISNPVSMTTWGNTPENIAGIPPRNLFVPYLRDQGVKQGEQGYVSCRMTVWVNLNPAGASQRPSREYVKRVYVGMYPGIALF